MRLLGQRTVWRAVSVALVLTAASMVAWEPCLRVGLVLRREVYRLCERVGIMDPAGALGGQVAGFNYQRNPAWVHPVAATLSEWLGTAPLVLVALVVFQRAVLGRFGARDTLCGACGRKFGTVEPGVPVCTCGNDLRNPVGAGKGSQAVSLGVLPRWLGPARAIVFRRTAFAVVPPLAVFALMEVFDVRWRLVYWLIEEGKAWGGQVTQLGVTVWSSAGPFSGGGRMDRVFNALVSHGPPAVQCVAAVLVAVVTAFVLARLESPLRPPHVARTWIGRALGHRGPTVCGACRSVLAGIRCRKCAECGHEF